MTNPTPLSPQAQVVLDAFLAGTWESAKDRQRLAAALRAAADEVAPETPPNQPGDPEMLLGIWSERRTIRDELLAIAAELEGQ